ncbi:MAG TPA: enoyl-CoA hydratase/isomerase family protein [Candidimonas sp.]|nr:enoyl-CoA hydratase/isomerase family protein [Candidimonas sp.]
MNIQPLIHNVADQISHIILNRPEKRNALSFDLVERLHECVDSAHEAGHRAIIIEGEGKNFSAGFDFYDTEHASESDLRWRFIRIQQLLSKITRSPLLTVALGHGKNFGAGVDLLAACQWRIASRDSSFRMPGLKFDLLLGSARFAALVGAQKAQQILEQSATFDAAHALEMGFLSQLADREDWGSIKQKATTTASALSPNARRLLQAAITSHDYDKDMSLLIESLSMPGLQGRIERYLGS